MAAAPASPNTARVAGVLVITSDRGLAGAYNSNVLRAAVAHIEEQRAHGVEPQVHMVGRKGINFFKFLRREIAEQTTGLGDKPRFEQIEPIANALMDRFIRGEIASVHVAYMRFHSAGDPYDPFLVRGGALPGWSSRG